MTKEIFEKYIKKMQEEKINKMVIYLSSGRNCNINDINKDKIKLYPFHIEVEKAAEYGFTSFLVIPYTSIVYVEIGK